ncbi:6-phosphogluconolactonase [Candidatus Mycoplasma pogonae]
MADLKIKILASKEKMAKIIAKEIGKKILHNSKVNIGLATDKPLLPFYKTLHKVLAKPQLNLTEVEFFLTSRFEIKNDALIQETWINNIFQNQTITSSQINLPNPHNYDDLIKLAGGLDLLVLYLGTNGEIAFNFPNGKQDSVTHKIKIKDEKNLTLITMGLQTIMEAKNILLVVSGQDKTQVFRKVIKTKTFLPEIPASILKQHTNLFVLIDEEAF